MPHILNDNEIDEILNNIEIKSFVLYYVLEDILYSDLDSDGLALLLKKREVFNKYSLEEIKAFITIVRDLSNN